jgi:hypothetical protein
MRCSARKTYSQLLPHPLYLVAISHIGGSGEVVKRVGRLYLPGQLHQARVVFPAQKTQDAIDGASAILHNNLVHAQVIQKNY